MAAAPHATRPRAHHLLKAPGRWSPLLISIASGFYMAAAMARNFALPLRVTELGATKSEVGLILGLLVFTGGFVALAGGALGDYIGRRRTIVVAIAISALVQIGLALSTSIAPVYPLQIAAGIGFGTTQATLFAAAADAAAPGRIGRAMGTLVVGIQVGMLSGPALAGVAASWFNLQLVIGLASALYLVAIALVLVGVRPTSTRTRSREVLANLAATVRQWKYLTAAVATFAWSMLWPTVLGFLPLIGNEFLHLPVTQVGLLVAGLGGFSALCAVPAGRIVDRAPDKQALLAVTSVITGGLIIAFGHVPGSTIAIAVLMATVPIASVAGISVGLSHFTLATPQARGIAMGLLLTSQNLATGVGSPAFGVLLQRFGYTGGLDVLATCAVAITAFAVLLRVARRYRSMHEGPAV